MGKHPRNPWSDENEYITQCPIQPTKVHRQKIIFSTEEGALGALNPDHSYKERSTIQNGIRKRIRGRLHKMNPQSSSSFFFFKDYIAELLSTAGIDELNANCSDLTGRAGADGSACRAGVACRAVPVPVSRKSTRICPVTTDEPCRVDSPRSRSEFSEPFDRAVAELADQTRPDGHLYPQATLVQKRKEEQKERHSPPFILLSSFLPCTPPSCFIFRHRRLSPSEGRHCFFSRRFLCSVISFTVGDRDSAQRRVNYGLRRQEVNSWAGTISISLGKTVSDTIVLLRADVNKIESILGRLSRSRPDKQIELSFFEHSHAVLLSSVIAQVEQLAQLRVEIRLVYEDFDRKLCLHLHQYHRQEAMLIG
ncbi:hypothetical protein POM88_004334 [Heracleum sosnowskyi]|uniref:Uncharacterized protein n=1 Tax=Heracleum sosnowskyi TaxID=360622 RepID=A0AAD8JJM0_9APIA|nr:hypothetical protein POM88_004334 [Heracleum sosnowskyi]